MSDGIEFTLDNGGWYDYTAKKKMPSGMTAEVTFSGYMNRRETSVTFYVGLNVYKKRSYRDSNWNKVTGKDGLKPMLFAREAIVDFEKWFLEHSTYKDHHEDVFIAIQWTDKRRREAYHRGLKSLGYHYDSHWGEKVLIKKIK